MVAVGACIGPDATPISRLVVPAMAVFQSVVLLGLIPSMCAVKLLSSPQHTQAATTRMAETAPGQPPAERMPPATMTLPTPSQPRAPSHSPNTRLPSKAVAATSTVRSTDTEPAD